MGKCRQVSAHLDPIPLIPLVLCCVANNILIYVMEGNTDIGKKTCCGQLHLQTLAKESCFHIQETRKQVAPKVTAQGSFLIPAVVTALSLPTPFMVLSCHSGSEGLFTGLSLARQRYCFCLFFFLVDKSGSDGDISFPLPVFSCV